jgi:hypothetical protein
MRGSEIAKKGVCFASFSIKAKNRFASEKENRKEEKRSGKETICK